MAQLISIVIPTYNEEDNVRSLADTILNLSIVQSGKYRFELIFVDDGSSDKSLEKIKALRELHTNVHYIKLSRNAGHQNALKAGIDMAKGDCVISMDADMQHPPAIIETMILHWENGYDIVYTKRLETDGASAFKNKSSSLFYKLINLLSEVKLEEGTADFRLIDKKIAEIVKRTKEVELFFRAYIKSTGFKQIGIEYVAAQRHEGKSKYSIKAMLRLALIGITSYSTKPLHIAAYLGLFFSIGSLLFVPYILYSFFDGDAVSGWASLIITVAFFGGLQLFVLGIIGIYIGKIFKQVKQKPHYYIEETSLQYEP